MPVPWAIASLTDEPGTGFPPRSSTATTGCPEKAVPPLAPDGEVTQTTWAAVPTPTVNGSLTACGTPGEAWNGRDEPVGAGEIDRATGERRGAGAGRLRVGGAGELCPDRAALEGEARRGRNRVAASVGDRTTGCVPIGAPPVPPTGWIVKPTLAGPLPETRNGALEPVYALPEIVAVST